MSTAKRRNDRGQMRREEYEQDENKDGEENVGTFKMASNEAISKRKIIRRSVGGAWGAQPKVTPNPSGPENAPAASKTPMFAFGGAVVASPGSTAAKPTSPAATSNGGGLFGGINLTGASKTPTFQKSGAPLKNPFPKASSIVSTAVCNSDRKQISSSCEMFAYTQIRFPYSGRALEAVLNSIPSLKGYTPGNATSNDTVAQAQAAPASSAPFSISSASKIATADTDAKAPAPGGFNFGTSTQTNTAEAKPATPFKGFSFGGGSTLLAKESSNPSQSSTLSFPTPAAVTTAASASSGGNAQSAPSKDTEDGFAKEEPEMALKADNPDENSLHTVQANLYRLTPDDGWKGFGATPVQLLQSKKDPKFHRIVCRNTVGKVLFNMRVVNNMKFIKDIKKGKRTGFIRFIGLAEENTDGIPGKYMLKVRAEQIDELQNQLETMASKS
jgi:hypothetical protein